MTQELKIEQKFIEQAQTLCRGAEVLPDGYMALAAKLQKAHNENRPLRFDVMYQVVGKKSV